MSLRITDTAMTSTATEHTARLVDAELGLWTVTWLGDRYQLGRNQAISAMTLAEAVAGGVSPSSPEWPHVVGWANELGLAAQWAADRITRGGAR
nr:hypothetical protein [Kibdelosporangium sp. MJ126-NF4]CEL23346.1 hypothetical protein [Kibdelosporangium sp. MJ126-NF4]CTQ94508.1 hypothetical protein [Kibdelosporangium sp. MJ126-NF4]